MRFQVKAIIFVTLWLTSSVLADSTIPKERSFEFHYSGKVLNLNPGTSVRVWLPVPTSNAQQTVDIDRFELPGQAQLAIENEYGNRVLYFEATAPDSGQLDYSVLYGVTRREVKGLNSADHNELSKAERLRYLSANTRVPISGRVLNPILGLAVPQTTLDSARQLYESVWNHMKYDKSVPGYGKGDSLWACDARTGNCTDFHSLFISFARHRQIPSRFEIGFPLPLDRGQGKVGGYHCWASFFVEGLGWVPVDISEADKHPEQKDYYFGNLTENRIGFSVGRDIDLVPKQNGPSLNYFVYPYIEVDGQPWEQKKVEFRYKDRPTSF